MAPIYDSKLFDLWKKAGLDNNLRQRHPFTIFVSAKYLLDRFSHVEQSYLTSHYGQDDLKHALKYLMVPQAIFLNQHKQDETICKCFFVCFGLVSKKNKNLNKWNRHD